MALHVQRQVVGTREGALAQTALERPVAGVFAVVARQFVRAGKLPAAALPRALVRLLACVPVLCSRTAAEGRKIEKKSRSKIKVDAPLGSGPAFSTLDWPTASNDVISG